MSKEEKERIALEAVIESKKEKKLRKKGKREKKEKKEKKEKILSEENNEVEMNMQDDSEDNEVQEESNDNLKEKKETDLEEIEIDLNAQIPLSKKQERLKKKGKLDLDKLAKKNPAPKPISSEEDKIEEKPKKSEFGVWIGNLSFDTTKEDLVRFIIGKTSEFSSDTNSGGLVKVEESDITRVNLPKKEKKIKGFAYVDLPSLNHVNTVISLSESHLNGRKLLIKNANSFEGRPNKEVLSKNPPSRILFVGNLSFDTTDDLLEEHFRHCGEIVRIRMATFEDSGKCKGFAFIDFKDETGPTNALKSKLAKKFINRPLRLEYGEDRSKRTPNQRKPRDEDEDFVERVPVTERPVEKSETYNSKPKPKKRVFKDDNSSNTKRQKSSVALATAQRASAAIVPSSGKKITFD